MPAARAIEPATPNILDRLIGWVSPSAALQRLRARTAMLQLRSYDGAKAGRRTGGWMTGGTAANAEIVPALSQLRNRARDLVRNNPYARKAIAALVSASIGTGILCAVGAAAEVWKAWTKECDADGQLDWYGLQALIARTVLESGECLIRLRFRRPEDGFTVPLQLQVLEGDMLDARRMGPTVTGGMIIAGVEFDAIGRRVAYWLFPQHPGEIVYIPKSLQSVRTPAESIIHVYEKTRPGQVRGVPRLAVSMLRMRDLDDYEEAELVRKGIEACFAAVVTSADDQSEGVTGTLTDVNGKPVESLAAGMIAYGKPGQQITFGQPVSVADYGGYTGAQLHAIAAGAGVTYEQMTGDLSQVNYSSIRAGLLEVRREVEQFQWLTLVPMLLDPVAAVVLNTAILTGKLRRADLTAVEWTMPKWEWVDPLKEVEASRLEVAGAQVSWSERMRQRGYDPDKVIAEVGEDIDRFRATGLPDEMIFRILFDVTLKGTPVTAAVQEPDNAPGKKTANRRAA